VRASPGGNPEGAAFAREGLFTGGTKCEQRDRHRIFGSFSATFHHRGGCDIAYRPAIGIAFSAADEQVDMVRKLREPSVIAAISISKVFLNTARGLLAPALEQRHTLCEYLLPVERPSDLRAADLAFCDSVAFERVKHPKRIVYRLVAPSSLEYVTTAMESYQSLITENTGA
jgi:hypothetical protein